MKFHDQAKAWRIARKLSVKELADLSGYSEEAIWRFERPTNGQGLPHSEYSLQRYKLCCSGVDRQLRNGRAFEW